MVFSYNQKKMSKKERETEDGKAVRTYGRGVARIHLCRAKRAGTTVGA